MSKGYCSTQVSDDFEEGILDCGLGDPDIGDMGFEAANSPGVDEHEQTVDRGGLTLVRLRR